MLRRIVHTLPFLYDFLYHLECLKKANENERRKKIPRDQILYLVGVEYRNRIGHPLNWNNLTTYTEKMQWEKIYDLNPLKTQLADKYLVREWVSERIGDEYLIPLIGAWSSFDEIDFDFFPKQFVLKTNHGSGTNIIVKDKDKFSSSKAKRKINDWLRIDFGYNKDFELHYSNIKPMILAEEYLETEFGELQDYKFLCFDGTPMFCWVDMGRYSNHTRNVYDLDWNLQPWSQETYELYKDPIPRPKNFELMVELARNLSQGFPHVRVDLYNIDGKIYFGEMTFSNGSGLDRIIPEEYDAMLGSLWKLDTSTKGETSRKD